MTLEVDSNIVLTAFHLEIHLRLAAWWPGWSALFCSWAVLYCSSSRQKGLHPPSSLSGHRPAYVLESEGPGRGWWSLKVWRAEEQMGVSEGQNRENTGLGPLEKPLGQILFALNPHSQNGLWAKPYMPDGDLLLIWLSWLWNDIPQTVCALIRHKFLQSGTQGCREVVLSFESNCGLQGPRWKEVVLKEQSLLKTHKKSFSHF